MNKTELIDSVVSKTSLSKSDASKAVDAVFGSITETLSNKGAVTLVGFGTFSVATRAARTGRHPRTLEPLSIPESQVPKFKAGKGLKDAVN